MSAGESPLWRQVVAQSLWGRRGLVKTSHLWLPAAAFLSADASADLRRAAPACFLLLLAAACYSQGSILANDVADRREDGAAGKQRWVGTLRPAAGAAVVGAVFAAGLAAAAVGSRRPGAAAAYAAASLAGALYSARPVRLKERGVLGPAAYGLTSALAFVAMPWAWLGGPAGAAPLAALLGGCVFLDKWVNLHFHQVIDFEADRARGTRTYAVVEGLDAARRSLTWAAGLASACMAGLLVFLALELAPWGGPVAAAAAAAGVAGTACAALLRRRPGRGSALGRELPALYLGLTYAVFRVLPLVLLARLAARAPAMGAVFAAALALTALESWYSLRYRYD